MRPIIYRGGSANSWPHDAKLDGGASESRNQVASLTRFLMVVGDEYVVLKRLQDNLVWLTIVTITIGAIAVAGQGATDVTGAPMPDMAEIQARNSELDRQLQQVQEQERLEGDVQFTRCFGPSSAH
jgi:hypothetical protein